MSFVKFQHTAARRRLGNAALALALIYGFNTQPPEGGWNPIAHYSIAKSGFNTQPPEGGWETLCHGSGGNGSFNTQPPEGGWKQKAAAERIANSFNTQPPEGGWEAPKQPSRRLEMFQHTAARRRLGLPAGGCGFA